MIVTPTMYLFKKHLQPHLVSISRYMHNHAFSNFFCCQDNFLVNPDKVVDLAGTLEFIPSEVHPGKRTENLFQINDTCREFATYFAKRIADDVFPGMYNMLIDIRFHMNDVYDDDICNKGWIHNDPASVAGVLYLNKDTRDIDTGTSMFDKVSLGGFKNPDVKSRNDFNLNKIVSEQYKKDLEDNHSHFYETLRSGNKYNRLIAYDSSIWHRPNNYKMSNGENRLSIIFFIEKYEFQKHNSMLKVQPTWRDV